MVAKVVDRSGFRDWVIQRLTALVLGVYTIVIIGYLLAYQPLTYEQWYTFFHHLGMKIFTVAAVLCILWHAWIGLWTIFTDYVKPKAVRYTLEFFVIVLLLAYLVWAIEILWR